MCTAAARPARAPNAFIKFSSEHRAAVKATMPKDAKATDVAKELGARWRALSGKLSSRMQTLVSPSMDWSRCTRPSCSCPASLFVHCRRRARGLQGQGSRAPGDHGISGTFHCEFLAREVRSFQWPACRVENTGTCERIEFLRAAMPRVSLQRASVKSSVNLQANQRKIQLGREHNTAIVKNGEIFVER